MLPRWARVNLGAMAIKIRLFNVISGTFVGWGSLPSSEKQSVYCTAQPTGQPSIYVYIYKGWRSEKCKKIRWIFFLIILFILTLNDWRFIRILLYVLSFNNSTLIFSEDFTYIYIYIYTNHFLCLIIIFTNPSARAGYHTRSIFKRSLTGLNSEFSFSKTCYLT